MALAVNSKRRARRFFKYWYLGMGSPRNLIYMIHSEKDHAKVKAVKLKLARYCAYRDRSKQEVKLKLSHYGLSPAESEDIMRTLTEEGFLDERRFAVNYANGKFKSNSWGKIKISRGLESHGLSPDRIREGLESLDETQYQQKLEDLMKTKWERLAVDDVFIKKHRISSFLIGKGFEPSLVWELLDSMD